jgi:hypothetical protein
VCNKIFLGYQPCQVVEWQKNQRFEDHLCPRPQGTEVAGENQPTKKLTKGGVWRKRQTLSLARFDHSCVRDALLEMVKGALKL